MPAVTEKPRLNMQYSEEYIKNKVTEGLKASHVEVVDQSDGCGAKFSVVVVSDQFEGKPLLLRHRLVHGILEEELKTIHAISLTTLTPEQWGTQRLNTRLANVTISAPGKVILYGEHAVVYGKTAVAASINLRTSLNFTELSCPDKSANDIYIDFPNIKLFLVLPLNILNSFFNRDHMAAVITGHKNLHQSVKDFVSTIELDRTSNNIEQQKSSLQAFFYLLLNIGHHEQIDLRSFNVRLTTELPINAGLGSSASFAVCLAACFLRWSLLQKRNHSSFSNAELDKISHYALDCERIMHETPSGIDNSICTYGSIIQFRKKQIVSVLPRVPNLKILLVNTHVVRDTKVQVQRLAKLMDVYTPVITSIMESIDVLSTNAWAVLEAMTEDTEGTDPGSTDSFMKGEDYWYKKLSDLIRMNQGLLSALDASHSKLEMICATASIHSYAAKLTGAGGGGFAYVLLPPKAESKSIETFSKLLEEKGFTVMLTSLDCSGVRIEPQID